MRNKSQILMLGFAMCMSSCSYQVSDITTILSSPPRDSITAVTFATQCVGKKINDAFERKEDLPRILLIVDEFVDGTIPPSSASTVNGALSDLTKRDFVAILRRSVTQKAVKIPFEVPPVFSRRTVLGNHIKEELSAIHQQYGVDLIFRIRGAYTQADDTRVVQAGHSGTGRYTGDTTTGEFNIGNNSASQAITLTVEIGSPETNIVMMANSFTAITHSMSRTLTAAFGHRDVAFRISNDETYTEGFHAAQRTLAETAALWFLYRVYYQKIDLEECLSGKVAPSNVAKWSGEWRAMTEGARIEALQKLLRKAGFYKGKIGSQHQSEMLAAAGGFNKSRQGKVVATSYGLGELGDLYLALQDRFGE